MTQCVFKRSQLTEKSKVLVAITEGFLLNPQKGVFGGKLRNLTSAILCDALFKGHKKNLAISQSQNLFGPQRKIMATKDMGFELSKS